MARSITLWQPTVSSMRISRAFWKMLDVSKKGVFIVFRAGETEALSEFAYGPKPEADYLCLHYILKEMGHQFDVAIFTRNYLLP